MNYKTKSWWDRFGAQVCSADDDGNASGGGGDTSVDEGSSDEGGGDEGDTLDLASEDPLVIQKFPADHKLSPKQIQALMSFNPRKEEKKPEPEPVKKEAKKEEVKPGKQPKVDPKAPVWDAKAKRWRDPVTNKLVAAPKDAKPPEDKTPKPQPQPGPDKVDKLAETVQKLVDKSSQPQPDNKDGPKPFFGEGGARPALSAPDELMAMLEHEDPAQRKQAIGYMMTGVANRVMQEMFGAMSYMQQQMMQKIPGMIAGTVVQDRNSTSFYERHPHLNKPMLQPIVDQIGTIVAQQFQTEGRQWRAAGGGFTPDFMDEVALRAAEELGISQNPPLPEDQNVQDQNGAPQKRPFFNRKTGARPPVASRETEKSADIMGVVGFRGH